MKKGNGEYPKSDCPVRPYHLWNAREKKVVRYHYFSDAKRAHLGALLQIRWAPVGSCFEVIDVRVGKLLGQYTRRLHDIHFLE